MHIQWGNQLWNRFQRKPSSRIFKTTPKSTKARQPNFKIQTRTKEVPKSDCSNCWDSSRWNFFNEVCDAMWHRRRKLGDVKESPFRKLIRSYEGGVKKPFEIPTTCNNYRMDTTKTPRPTNTYNLLSTLLSTLASWWNQIIPRCRGRVGHAPERVTSSMAREGEVGHIPEGGTGKFEQDSEGGTVTVDH